MIYLDYLRRQLIKIKCLISYVRCRDSNPVPWEQEPASFPSLLQAFPLCLQHMITVSLIRIYIQFVVFHIWITYFTYDIITYEITCITYFTYITYLWFTYDWIRLLMIYLWFTYDLLRLLTITLLKNKTAYYEYAEQIFEPCTLRI